MLKTIVFIVLAVVVTAFVAEYRAYKREKNLTQKHRRELTSLNRDMLELKKLKVSSEQELTRAQFYLKELENWKAKAIQCYPEIESLVRVNLAQKEANAFLTHYPNLASIEATYTNYPLLVEALEAYSKLSDEAKMQTNITFEIIKRKRDAAFAHYVCTTTVYFQNADSNLQGIPEHLPQLTKIMEWFNNIPDVVRSKISGTIIISLAMKEAHAKYVTGMATELESEDYIAESSTVIAKFFDRLSDALSSLKKSFSTWIHKKWSSVKTSMTQTFSEDYYEDENDSDEEPFEEQTSAHEAKPATDTHESGDSDANPENINS